MNNNPYLPDDLPPEPPVPEEAPPQRALGCLSVNAITVVFLALTGVMLAYVILLLVNPYAPVNPFPPRTPLPVYVVASPNPSTTTPTPTKIPETPLLNTLAPTETPLPSATPTLPQPEATEVVVSPPQGTTAPTLPPSPTLVSGAAVDAGVGPVFTPPPPGDPAQFTRAPFPFTVYAEQAVYVANPNEQGCRWASIAGAVTNLDGQPVAGLAVRVVGQGIDDIRFSGTAPLYGLGGYEIFLNGAPLQETYTVQLLSQTGTPISAEFQVETSPVCEENVAVVNFVQNHDY